MAEEPVAIVTAAGRGIGAAIARELHSRGYRLALLSPSGAAQELASELGAVAVTGSVTEPDDLAALVDLTTGTYGRIDALVNNTGHAVKGPLLDVSDADWHAGFDLILLSVIRLSRLVTPVMQAQGSGGAIVNISSYAAYEPDAAFPLSIMRAGLGAFTKLYADAHANDDIRMNCLLPGFIDSLPEKPERKAQIPMGRYGRVSEIATTAAFLLSPEAGYITGQNLRADGGITRGV